jgi:hypothetical protein
MERREKGQQKVVLETLVMRASKPNKKQLSL